MRILEKRTYFTEEGIELNVGDIVTIKIQDSEGEKEIKGRISQIDNIRFWLDSSTLYFASINKFSFEYVLSIKICQSKEADNETKHRNLHT